MYRIARFTLACVGCMLGLLMAQPTAQAEVYPVEVLDPADYESLYVCPVSGLTENIYTCSEPDWYNYTACSDFVFFTDRYGSNAIWDEDGLPVGYSRTLIDGAMSAGKYWPEIWDALLLLGLTGESQAQVEEATERMTYQELQTQLLQAQRDIKGLQKELRRIKLVEVKAQRRQ